MWNRKHTNAKAHTREIISESDKQNKIHSADAVEARMDLAYEINPQKRSKVAKEYTKFHNIKMAISITALPWQVVSGKFKIIFSVHSSVTPECEFIERGMLHSTSSNTTSADLVLENEDDSIIKSTFSKSMARKIITGIPITLKDAGKFYAVGYLKYKDSTGEMHTLYTDMITSHGNMTENVESIKCGE